jgi:hypothetical protein
MGRPRKNPVVTPKQKEVASYCKQKIHMLEDPKGFGLTLTEAEKNHMRKLKTETAIDNYAIDIFYSRWGEE